MPDDLRPDRRRGELEKGEHDWRATIDGMVGILWYDSVLCNFLSTFHHPDDVVEVPRRERGQVDRIMRRSPSAAADYNRSMGAVDRFDSLRKSYTTSRGCRRWYFALVAWFLDSVAIQSMIVFNNMREGGKDMSHMAFLEELARELLGGGPAVEEALRKASQWRKWRGSGVPCCAEQSRKRRRCGDGRSAKRHCSRPYAKKSTSRRICKECAKHGMQKRVSYECEECGTHLHPECFGKFHAPL